MLAQWWVAPIHVGADADVGERDHRPVSNTRSRYWLRRIFPHNGMLIFFPPSSYGGFLGRGAPAVGFQKNVRKEDVWESGNQNQNTGTDFRHNPEEIRQNGSRNKGKNCSEVACEACACNKSSALSLHSQNGSRNEGENCSEIACEACAHTKSSALSLHSQKFGSCHQICNPIQKHFSTGLLDAVKAVHAIDTEDRVVKTQSSSKKVHSQGVDQEIIGALDAGDDEKLINSSDIRCHSNPAANAVETEKLGLKGCRLRAFSFMENHAGSQATAGKVAGYDMKEIQHKEQCGASKERIRHEHMMSPKSQKVRTVNLVSHKITGKQPWFLPIGGSRNFRQPTHHFTCADIERLVTAVEKFGIGRWRDIKETYFSVEEHRSPGNLKDKWRSLLLSVKLPPEKRRSVKLPPMLVRRILILMKEKSLHISGDQL